MRILIICSNIGRTAPGIVFERLVDGLSRFHEVDVLTADLDPNVNLNSVKKIHEIKQTKIHPRIFKFIIALFGINPLDRLWAKRAIKKVNKENKYNVIFSLISFHHYYPLLAGYFFSNKSKSKFAVYSVDAIPAPLGWSKDDTYFRQVRKLMSKYIPKTDVFFSANKQMLQYQMSFIKTQPSFKSDVIYNPNDGVIKQYEIVDNNKNIFLYTGGIYQVRKVDYILRAFEKFIHHFPNSKFIFVGSQLSESLLNSISLEARKAIEIHPFSRDLEPYYKNASALIDIDADLIDDVFLSSKIVNYLLINRVIISETGLNSPSRHLFKGINSILQCNHNEEELYNAMKKSVLIKNAISFDDRSEVIELFSIDNILKTFNRNLQQQ